MRDTHFTPAMAAAYQRDGFYAPVDAFSRTEVAQMRQRLEAFEATLPERPIGRNHRRKLHVLLPWMRDLVEDPRILDAVEQLIGPDILVFTSTFFIKEPNSDTITAWHQDGTYFGLEPHEHVTAWVAFSEASELAGCMRFIAGSHKRGQLEHVTQTSSNNLNNLGQHIPEPFDEAQAATAPLQPGQFSLHHTLVVHSSEPNRSSDRRIGLGISYIPTRLRHKGSQPMSVTLVRGEDRFGHFEHEADPRKSSPQEAIAAHARAYQRYRESYEEQMRLSTTRG
ncbi:MAG: phytanoyl-CoA dioxygenase family protein [Burkholderiaceae bacterium]|nr:phytanoyl-CoA dioxygenase family protein [Burkholderiaceae bacterium]MDO9090489.1 phytanoyl-CoA dioxygenase family protein [Burkholderiaceae bacterium]